MALHNTETKMELLWFSRWRVRRRWSHRQPVNTFVNAWTVHTLDKEKMCMHLHKMHTPPPVWLIYLRPLRQFRKFHYDPHSSQCSRPDWGHLPPLVFIPAVCIHTHTHTHWGGDSHWYTAHANPYSLSMTEISNLITVPNHSEGPKPNHMPQLKLLHFLIFLKPYL